LPALDAVTSTLRRLTKLNVYKAKNGEAPHKALLLLVLIELAERGELPTDVLPLTAELAFRFDTYWEIVAYRQPQRSDVRYPFHHLGGDGLSSPFMASGDASPDPAMTRFVRLNPEFVVAVANPGFRDQARRFLIARYFRPAERNALFHMVGIPIPSDDQVATDAMFKVPDDAAIKGREARFRLDIVSAYNYTCALTRYRVTTIDAGSIVDAAHIHEFFGFAKQRSWQRARALQKRTLAVRRRPMEHRRRVQSYRGAGRIFAKIVPIRRSYRNFMRAPALTD